MVVSLQAAPASSDSTTKPIEALFNDAQLDAIWRGSWRLTATDEDARFFYDATLTSLATTISKNEREFFICGMDRQYFIETYCQIYDPPSKDWIPFKLWAAQIEVLEATIEHQLIIELKPRQIGLTWLNLGYAAWEMLFRPIAKILLFSLRETEAKYLLGEERLKGILKRLPEWMRPAFVVDNELSLELANGSNARAFPTSAGDSYSATFALVDEADLVPDLERLLRSVKPTIDAGGKLVLLSRSDKKHPASAFKNIYRAAKQKLNEWHPIFLAWYVHPGRDEAWYEKQCKDALANEGSLDSIHEQYPATDAEALAPATLNKRINPDWVNNRYRELEPIPTPTAAPNITDFVMWKRPDPTREYVIGLDPAEGKETSDESALTVLDKKTGEQVAVLAGQIEYAVFAAYADEIGRYYNHAALMVERNNHGHAVLLWLQENSTLVLVIGHNDEIGWLTNTKGKALLYSDVADAFREGMVLVHDFTTLTQLMSIERSTLSAPKGEHDDRAVAFALAWQGVLRAPAKELLFITV